MQQKRVENRDTYLSNFTDDQPISSGTTYSSSFISLLFSTLPKHTTINRMIAAIANEPIMVIKYRLGFSIPFPFNNIFLY